MRADDAQPLLVHAFHMGAQLLDAGEGLCASTLGVTRRASTPRHALQICVQRQPPQLRRRLVVVHLAAGDTPNQNVMEPESAAGVYMCTAEEL